MRQEMQLASPMQHENDPMRLNVYELCGQVDIVVGRDLSFVTCPLSHKTMF